MVSSFDVKSKFYVLCGFYDKDTHRLLGTTILHDLQNMDDVKDGKIFPDNIDIERFDKESVNILFRFEVKYTIDELKKLIESKLQNIDNLYDMEYPLTQENTEIELPALEHLDNDFMYKKYFEREYLIRLITSYDILLYDENYRNSKLPELYSPTDKVAFTREYHDTFVKNLKNAINLLVKHGFITQNKEITVNGNF